MVLRNQTGYMRVQAHELSQSSNSNSLSPVPLAFVYLALGLFSYQSAVPSPLPHRGAGTPDKQRHLSSKSQFCMELLVVLLKIPRVAAQEMQFDNSTCRSGLPIESQQILLQEAPVLDQLVF